MAATAQVPSYHSAAPTVVGRAPNFWLFTNHSGFDLTHPESPNSPQVQPRIRLETVNTPVTIAPAKTALVIVDMQNFFLSAAIGRKRGEGHRAENILLRYGIPAARDASMQIIWLTWGITDEELEAVPPTVWRIFGFEIADEGDFEVADDQSSRSVGGIRRKERKCEGGLGSPLGEVKFKDGSTIDAGRMLMRDQWNTALHDPLSKAFDEGQKAKVPDLRFHKARLSGLWGPTTRLEKFLGEKGIKTLLFAGVNTDQCVLATLQDANTKGFDTILLMDGCGTTSPDYTKKMVEFNCQKSWGFVSSCANLYHGVKRMLENERAPQGASDAKSEL